MRVLIADDDRALSQLLGRGLKANGDQVELAHDGDTALALFLEKEPDLLILDLEMPGRRGDELLTIIRSIAPLCPVIVVSGIAETAMRIACLDLGADDCIQKPFSLHELRARCRAVVRRAVMFEQFRQQSLELSDGPATLQSGALTMRRARRQVEIDGAPVHLTNREYELLEQLLMGQGSPVSREALRRAVWGEKPMETNALDVHLASLRRKLSPWQEAVRIETVRGAGFRVAMPVVLIPSPGEHVHHARA